MINKITLFLGKPAIALLLAFLTIPMEANSSPYGVFQFGGQVCQPMNLNIALKGLQWRSEGAINTSNQNLWVVCPVPSVGLTVTTGDVVATVMNANGHGVDITCLVKVTDITSGSARTINYTQFVPAGGWGFVGAERVFISDTETVSISCKLPPGSGISSILSEMY